jgi:GNAT superfamily N-acetyltransferase
MKIIKTYDELFEKKEFATAPDVENFSAWWANQVKQYPQNGPEGISYFKGEVRDKWVDCLLYRNKAGKLIGVLNHYPFSFPPYESKGNINVMVDPKEQKKGIGKKLMAEAIKRWKDIDLYKQKWTSSGKHMLDAYLKK